MNDSPKLRRRIDLWRPIYEWGTLAFTTLAIACLVDWGIAACSSSGDTTALVGPRGITVVVQRGAILLSSDFNESLASLESYPANYVTSDRRADLPGFHWRRQQYHWPQTNYVDPADWAAEMSLLWPFAISAVLAIVCFRGYRSGRRQSDSADFGFEVPSTGSPKAIP